MWFEEGRAWRRMEKHLQYYQEKDLVSQVVKPGAAQDANLWLCWIVSWLDAGSGRQKEHCWNYPTDPFKISELQNSLIVDDLYVVKLRRLTNFEAQELWKGRWGIQNHLAFHLSRRRGSQFYDASKLAAPFERRGQKAPHKSNCRGSSTQVYLYVHTQTPIYLALAKWTTHFPRWQ